MVPCYTLGTTKEFTMVLLKTKRYVFPVILLVLVVGVVFLLVSPAQVVRDPSVSEESLMQSSLPSRAPVGYEVPAREVVTLPFTHVSADRLRLGDVREVAEGRWVTVINPSVDNYYNVSPDGQWSLSRGLNLYITRTDGSGEKRALLTHSRDNPDDIIYISTNRIVWSWDSSRIFYPFRRQYYLDAESLTSEYEQWVESVNIETGEVTRHTDIGYYANLHSHATARYPTDPVIFDDSFDYPPEGPRGIKTHDGSARWVIPGFRPFSLSPNKRLVLGLEEGGKIIGETGYIMHYLIYAVDGTGPLYSFYGADTPKWSPDSSKFAYYHVTEREAGTGILLASDIYLMNIDGTGITQLTDTPDIPEDLHGWTPDGRLVFSIEGDLYIADLVTE